MTLSRAITLLERREVLGRLATPSGRAPLSGQWELTWRCNLHCIHCYTDPLNTPPLVAAELGADMIAGILDEIRDAGCLYLALSGGEALARPDFPQIYEAAVTRGLLVTVFTNGTLITERTIDLWQRLPPERIEVTLNGISPAVYEAVTAVAGSFPLVMRGIRLVHAAGLPLVVKANAMTANVDELLAIKEFVRDLPGVQFKMSEEIFAKLDGSHESCELNVPRERLLAIEASDPELAEGRRRQDELSAQPPTCEGGDYSFHIDPLGRLQRCARNREASYDLTRGSFAEGFFGAMPDFPCSKRRTQEATS